MTMTQTTSCHIRWMIRNDLKSVLDIEWCSFRDYWKEAEFLQCLRQRNTIGQVASITNHAGHECVVGFMIYELHKTRLNILNFAVHPNFRRKGIGGAMIRKLTGKLCVHRRTRATVTLRESNLLGHLFLRSMGFKAAMVVRDHFDDEDGYAFAYKLPESV